MKIDGNTIYFRSTLDNYEAEKNWTKSNTVRFVNTFENQTDIKRLRAIVLGQAPPTSRPGGYYPKMYEYQKKFKENYPLMYPDN